MKIFKSHFWYNKNHRNGIFLLVVIIGILQILIFKDVFKNNDNVVIHEKDRLKIQQEIDSLKLLAIESRKPKIFPFNPNYITDYKGEKLGMSTAEIDRLLAFRKQGKFINSKADFKKVTKVSDSLLNLIGPYFKFPEWVLKRNQQNKNKSLSNQKSASSKEKTAYVVSTSDINVANFSDFLSIDGIDEKLSQRIIKYRKKIQGFTYNYQLQEVWGLSTAQSNKILRTFKIVTKPTIKKENINTVNFKQLLKNPYLDYDLCKKIFDYRDEVAEFQHISEIKNIKDFPLELYDRIVLYLLAK